MSMPLLDVRDLTLAFGAREVVQGLSFSIAPGEVLALVGESGSGKSATALAILRLIEREGGRILRGTITLDGALPCDLATLSDSAMQAVRGAQVAMVFQEPMTSLNPVLTIGDQLTETYLRHRRMTPAAALEAAIEALARVRIAEPRRRLAQYPHELSGGLRQRVMIAMALACRPRLLIADEPTTALDVTTQGEILALIRELQAESGMAVLFITHDMGVVAEMADRVVVLKDGRKVEAATVADLFARPVAPYTKTLVAAAPRLGAGAPPAPCPAQSVLEVEGLCTHFPLRRGLLRRTVGVIHAVEDVSLSIAGGETLGLVGESGCGKSTLARTILRLGPRHAGRIRIGGADVTELAGRALLPMRRQAQMIFQDPFASLNPRLPVWDLVTEPAHIHRLDAARDRKSLAVQLVEKVGLPADCITRYPHQFSGGQRQRLCIARALSVGPSLIVADEPVSALDVSIARQVTDLIQDLQRREGLAFLFISHDIAVVERVSHRIAVMYAGEIVETGPTDRVLSAPQHPYTRHLLAAVPTPVPGMRRRRVAADPSEMPSLLRPEGVVRRPSILIECAPGHLVRQEAA